MISRKDFKTALGEADAGFDRALDAALRSIRAKEARPVMKKKLSVGLLAAVIAALALMGAALAVGLNLFDVFGRSDARIARLAPQAELATETPGEVKTEETGASAVEIVNAYYDGQSLIVSYTAENARTFEPFTPTAEELAKMELLDDEFSGNSFIPFEFGGLDPVQQAFVDAVEAGRPCGYAEYSVFADDTMYAGADGAIELVPYTCDETALEGGRKAYLAEIAMPLPEAAQDQEELELHLPILRNEWRVWFDGENTYTLNGPLDAEMRTYEWIDSETYTSYSTDPQQIGEAVATVRRSDGETRRYMGEGSYNGMPVPVTATVSVVHASLEIRSDGEALPDLKVLCPEADNLLWYDLALEDENGTTLLMDRSGYDSNWILGEFSGNGHVPEQLRLTIGIGGEGDRDGAPERSEPIILTPVE